MAINRDWKLRNLTKLDLREVRVLIHVGSYMPIKAADIAYQCRLDSYTVSRAVKKLLALGLMRTHKDEVKKNVKNLYLNDEGKVLYQKLTSAMKERAKQLESIFSNDEIEILFNMLERIEYKAETFLAEQASELIKQGLEAPADQKELIRWHKKTNS